MILEDGYHEVPAGKLAAVVTYLEMRERPARRPEWADAPWRLRRVDEPEADWYWDLHGRVGRDWVWFSRMTLDREAATAAITAESVEIHALEFEGRDEGLVELDFQGHECEIVFFGVTDRLIGQGAGRWMMNRALDLAFARPIERLWLHTCTLDHPGALDFYIRSGFVPYRRQVEIADDPRLTGAFDPDAAPQVPRI